MDYSIKNWIFACILLKARAPTLQTPAPMAGPKIKKDPILIYSTGQWWGDLTRLVISVS